MLEARVRGPIMAKHFNGRVKPVHGALVAAILLAACSTPTTPATKSAAPAADPNSARLQEYYDRAKAAGEMKVTLYSAGPEYRPIFDQFQERYPGTQVEGVVLRGPEMIQRFQ